VIALIPDETLTPFAFALYIMRKTMKVCPGWSYEAYRASLDEIAARVGK